MATPASADLGPLTMDLSDTSLTTTPDSHLLSLPRELRDQIYAYLLRAGSVAIMRTSKQIHEEVKERLFHDAVFRVKVGFADGRVSSFPTVWKNIESFHFHIFVGSGNAFPYPPTFRLFDRFANLDEIHLKRECLITIQCRPFDHRSTNGRDAYLLSLSEKIACLNTFTTVTVALVPNASELWANVSKPLSAADMDLWGVECIMADVWTDLKKKLELKMGPGSFEDKDDQERRLVFHPQR